MKEGMQMDNMTAKVSCFARAWHYRNNTVHIFADDAAEKLLGEDYDRIAASMSHDTLQSPEKPTW